MSTRSSGALAAAAAVVVVCGGCTRSYSRTAALPHPYGDVWSASFRAVTEKNFAIDRKNRDKGVIETEWKFEAHPHYGQGKRRRLSLAIVEDEDSTEKKKVYRVRVKIEKEMNKNIHDPLEYSQADWQEEGRDTDLEKDVCHQILIILDPDWWKTRGFEERMKREDEQRRKIEELEKKRRDLEGRGPR